jgi:hypothetical protein
MKTIQLSTPGRGNWTNAVVLSQDATGIYVGLDGHLGLPGSIVLIRYFEGGREIRKVGRQSKILGRYDFLQPKAGKPAIAA